MDYKEKYNKLVNAIKVLQETNPSDEGIQNWVNDNVPELKENEYESTRKKLIHLVKKSHEQGGYALHEWEADEMLAWLEKQGNPNKEYWRGYKDGKKTILGRYSELKTQDKQKPIVIIPKFRVGDEVITENEESLTITRIDKEGYWSNDLFICSFNDSDEWELVEQKPYGQREECLNCQFNYAGECKGYCTMKRNERKPADKVEPKFHKGDWIVFNGLTLNIKEVVKGYYRTTSIDGIANSYDWDIDSVARLWAIQDARDADVLACNEEILLFKSYSVQNRISLYCWYNGQTGNFHSKGVTDTSLTTRNKVCPATKEQRDTLFAKMKEAGYEWDAKNKELNKIHIIDEGKDCRYSIITR